MSYTFLKNFQNIQTSYIQEIDLHIYEDIAKFRKFFFTNSRRYHISSGTCSVALVFCYPLVCFLWLLRLGGARLWQALPISTKPVSP